MKMLKDLLGKGQNIAKLHSSIAITLAVASFFVAYNVSRLGLDDNWYFIFDWIGRCLIFISISLIAPKYIRFVSILSLGFCLIGFMAETFGQGTVYNKYEYMVAAGFFIVVFRIFYFKD